MKEREVSREKRRSRAEREHERRYREIRREFARGNMPSLLGRYLASCGHGDAEEELEETASAKNKRSLKKEKGVLPNPAGFCRFLGLSRDAYGRLEAEFPTEVGRIRAVFEDEALNSELSATVLAFYLKSLLGEEDDGKEGKGELLVTFEHDILSDGR